MIRIHTLVRAGLRAHASRLALAALATLVGTAFVTGTLVLGATLQSDVDQRITAAAQRADVVATTGNQLRPFPRDTLARVAAVAGVARAQGAISGDITVLDADGRPLRSQPLGVSTTMRTEVTGGRSPADDGEVLVADPTARDLHVGIGGVVGVLDHATGRPLTLRVTGLMSVAGEGALALRGGLGFTPTVAAQVTGRTGFSEIHVAGRDPERLRGAVAAVIGPGPFTVATGREAPEARAAASGIDPGVLRTGLVMFALVALLVAGFVIANTFTVLVAQRRRELALLRCVGGSRRQVLVLVLAEAAVLGGAAATLGAGVGVAAAALAAQVMNAGGAAISTAAFTVSSSTVAVGLATGGVATVAAVLVPARAATQVSPPDALRPEPQAPTRSDRRARHAVATTAGTLGVASTIVGLLADGRRYPLVLVGAGGVAVFVAVVILGPLWIRALALIAGRPLAWLFAVPGRLAVANVVRNPRRASTTVLAMVIGVTLTTGVLVITESLSSSVEVGVDRALPADYLITPPGTAVTVPRSVAADFRRRAEVTSVTVVRETPVAATGRDAMLSTLDGSLPPTLLRGTLDGMGSTSLALRPERAAELGVDVGATVDVKIAGRTVPMVVAAVITGPAVPRMTITAAAFDALVPGRGDSAVLIGFRRDLTPAATRAVVDQVTSPQPTLRIVSAQDARDRLTDTLSRVTALLTGLFAFAVAISLVGVTNTLALSVLERSRESAVLRALGLDGRGLRRMLSLEAFLFGLLGGALGAGLGTAYGLAAARVINDDVVLTVPLTTVVLIVLGSGCAAVLASLAPVRRATRTPVVHALTEH